MLRVAPGTTRLKVTKDRGGNSAGGRVYQGWTAESGLLLAVPVVGFGGAEGFSGWAQAPLVGVGIVAGVDGRVVGDDQDLELGGAGVEEWGRYAGRVNKHVAGADGGEAVGGAHGAGAGAEDEQFLLTDVEVRGADRCAGWETADLEIERMAAVPDAGVAQAAESDRAVAGERVKFFGGRVRLVLREGIEVDVVHEGWARTTDYPRFRS